MLLFLLKLYFIYQFCLHLIQWCMVVERTRYVGLLCCSARSPTNVTVVGGAGPATTPRPVSSHVAQELAPNAANVMTAWTDKLYTENMGIIFTNAVTPSAVASSAGMVAAAASSASGSSGISAGGGMLMNNGRQDTSLADIQKLQQQLQDIKDQVHCNFDVIIQVFRDHTANLKNCQYVSGDTVYAVVTITGLQNHFYCTLGQ